MPTLAIGFLFFGTLDYICIKLKILTFKEASDDAIDDNTNQNIQWTETLALSKYQRVKYSIMSACDGIYHIKNQGEVEVLYLEQYKTKKAQTAGSWNKILFLNKNPNFILNISSIIENRECRLDDLRVTRK